MKTREEVEELQKKWEKDPCWDIEDTEGFEYYKEELKKFSDLKKIEWDYRFELEKIEKRRKFKELKLHEEMSLVGGVLVFKVSSGWIYCFNDDGTADRVFVPEK